MENYDKTMILRMLKNGADPKNIQQEIQKEQRKKYRPDFVSFMQDMLDAYGVTRKDIARRTGISQDYLYKLLNGAKKTAERDYIVAICLAVGMNLPETQYALKINGLAYLDDKDYREYLLMNCLSEHRGMFNTDRWLENAGFPLLRTSSDMEKYTPAYEYSQNDIRPTVIEEEEIELADPDEPRRPKQRYKVISREVFAEHCGNAPYDYTYWGNIVVKNKKGEKFHVQGFYAPDFTAYSVLDHKNYLKHEKWLKNNEDMKAVDSWSLDPLDTLSYEEAEKLLKNPEKIEKIYAGETVEGFEDISAWTTLETYENIDDAIDSDFFRYFLEIDKLTDDKVREVYAELCDTAKYGRRFGCQVSGKGVMAYEEMYDEQCPERKQYFQVVDIDGKTTYSASHESVFMWLEMGDFYSAVFGEREEPKYYIHITDEKELFDLPMRDRFIFNSLKTDLHANMKAADSEMFHVDDKQILDEHIQSLAEAATWCLHAGDLNQSLEFNKQVLELAEKGEKEYEVDNLNTILPTLSKISFLYSEMGNEKEADEWAKKVLDYRDQVWKIAKDEKQKDNTAPVNYAHSLLDFTSEAAEKGDVNQVKEYCKEIIDLIEDRITDEHDAGILFIAYLNYSFLLDEDHASDQAIEYYEKAERLVRRYHLEKGRYARNVPPFYNNYAWVLWNRFENEEAIIYYGKAIEYAEDWMNENSGPDKQYYREALEHYASELYNLYLQTGKEKEAERLQNRLKEYKITLK